MKAPSFWYRKPSLPAYLLAPLGQFYRTGHLCRRIFAKPYKPAVPSICVGNIVAGGAGKTPTSIALARYLIRQDARPAFVTRGYGGKLKGPVRVDPKLHTAADVGDEALLLAQVAPCWIARDRVAGMKAAEAEATHLILDDGLQNPNITTDVRLLVVDGAVGFGNRMMIPAGPLRETLNDAFSRVNAIVMVGEDAQRVAQCLGKTVLSAVVRPTLPSAFLSEPNVLAFAGIGRPQKFYDSCVEAGLKIVETHDFPDHHPYTIKDLAELTTRAHNKDLRLITTAKDWVRVPDAFRADVAVLDIELGFVDEEALARVLQSLTTAPRDPS